MLPVIRLAKFWPIEAKSMKTKILFIFNPAYNDKLYHPQAIADTFSHYHSSLYNPKNYTTIPQPSAEIINEFLKQVNFPQLSEAQLHKLNSPFTPSEISLAIKSLPNNKSPGFSGEYFKTFLHVLLPHLTIIFNAAVASSSFPPEMLNALIIALPKPVKDPISPQNFRPISLFNKGLKRYAKLLTTRLVDILLHIIHPDQSGFTKGHQTSHTTQCLINIIHQASKHRTPSLLLTLDTEKAFNRINWDYLA